MLHRHVHEAKDKILLLNMDKINFTIRKKKSVNVLVPTSFISDMLSIAPEEVVPTVATGQHNKVSITWN